MPRFQSTLFHSKFDAGDFITCEVCGFRQWTLVPHIRKYCAKCIADRIDEKGSIQGQTKTLIRMIQRKLNISELDAKNLLKELNKSK